MQEIDNGKVYLLLHLPGWPPSVLLVNGVQGASLISAEINNGRGPETALREAVNSLASPKLEYSIDKFGPGVELSGHFPGDTGALRLAYCAIAKNSGFSVVDRSINKNIDSHYRLNKGSFWVSLDDVFSYGLDDYSTRIISDFEELYRYVKPETDYLSPHNGWRVPEKIKLLNGKAKDVVRSSEGKIPTDTLSNNLLYLWNTRDQRRQVR